MNTTAITQCNSKKYTFKYENQNRDMQNFKKQLTINSKSNKQKLIKI